MRKYLSLFLALVLVVAFTGCATVGGVKNDWAAKSPKEKALVFMQTFNAQYDDVVSVVENAGGYDNLGPAMKQVIDAKVEILKKAHPLIKAYVLLVESGITPDAQTEALILDLLNQLIALSAKAGGDA